MSKSPFHPSKAGLKLAALTLGLACAAQSMAATDLTVISFGGANKDAQTKAFYQPFEKATGNKIVAGEYNGEMAKVKAMVDTNSVTWDLVEVESPELARGCDEGMFEEIDPAILGKAEDYVPGAVSSCGVGFFVWSTVLAYNADKLKTAPTGWADFWDLKKYPGKRGLRKRAVYNLEFALLADGVKVEDVYKVLATPAGVERAFAKLSELKPHIQWWDAGAQPAQWLAAGDVVMTSTYSGRIAVAAQQGSPLAVVWPGSLYGMDYWAIIKGSRHVDQAKRLIAFANQPDTQVRYVQQIPYGPTNTQAAAKLDPSLASWVPTSPQNLQGALAMNVEFWVDHGEELEQRFNAWASK